MMQKEFVMSKYINREQLLEDKAKYYEEKYKQTLRRLYLSKRDNRNNRNKLINQWYKLWDNYFEALDEIGDIYYKYKIKIENSKRRFLNEQD